MISYFFNDPATTVIYTYLHTLSLHYAVAILRARHGGRAGVSEVGDDPLPSCAGRRIPGRQQAPDALPKPGLRQPPERLGGRRRRPVAVWLARRRRPLRRGFHPAFPGRQDLRSVPDLQVPARHSGSHLGDDRT